MTRTTRTPTQRTGDWKVAFDAIETELNPTELTALAALAKPEGTPSEIGLGVAISKIVYANRRAAALAAAIITQSGVSRPVITEEADVPENDTDLV